MANDETVRDRPTAEREQAPPDRDKAAAPPQSSGKSKAEEERRRADEERERSRRRRRPWVLLVGLVILVLAIGAGVYYWLSTRNQLSTDDAYTDGRAIQVAPRVSGQVVQLLVGDNEFVRQGQRLIEIDPRSFEDAVRQAQGNLAVVRAQLEGAKYEAEIAAVNFPARLEQARANLLQAQASLYQAETDYKRQHALPAAATTQQAVDHANAAYATAKAQVALAEAQVREATPVPQNIGNANASVSQLTGTVEQAEAQLANAQLQLSWCTVRAPHDGWVAKRSVELGSYVQPGQAILSVVQPDVWVTANFRETDLNGMRPGQRVSIHVDAYPGLKLTGEVQGVEMGTGSVFSAFPPQNATGNFVKIVQRVPVKIVIDGGLDPNVPLPLGLSVEPTVHLK